MCLCDIPAFFVLCRWWTWWMKLYVLLFFCQILLHTELKVAVRACEGKAIHRRTQNFVFDKRTEVLNWGPQNESKNNNFQTPVFQLFISLLYRRTYFFSRRRRRRARKIMDFCSYVKYIIAHGIHRRTRNFVFDKRTEEHICVNAKGAEALRYFAPLREN